MDSRTVRDRRKKKNKRPMNGEGGEEESDLDEACDVEAWDTLSKSFKQAQAALDHNRNLIKQVNDNHQSKNHDHIAKNVDLICEINGNISKVINIYSDLSTNFTSMVHDRRRSRNGSNADSTSKSS